MNKLSLKTKFKIEWYNCRELEGRNVLDSFARAVKYMFTKDIYWTERTK